MKHSQNIHEPINLDEQVPRFDDLQSVFDEQRRRIATVVDRQATPVVPRNNAHLNYRHVAATAAVILAATVAWAIFIPSSAQGSPVVYLAPDSDWPAEQYIDHTQHIIDKIILPCTTI